MEQQFVQFPIQDTEKPRRSGSPVAWIVMGSTLAVAGYFFGLHSGTSLSDVSPAANAGSAAPDQADNSLPLGPRIGVNPGQNDLFTRARLSNELLYTDLQSFVCNEHMDRYKSRSSGADPRQIDTVNTQVSFENGVENYSDIHQNDRLRPSLSTLPGAWSEGEFGTLLRQTRALLSSQPVSIQDNSELSGVPASVYTFDVSGAESPWDLAVGTQQYRIPFRTNVWVAKSSGQMLKISRTTTAIPTQSGISQIQWGVVLKPIDLDGKTWLLPSSGEYSVAYQNSDHREWNTISFTDYRHYASRSVIHF